MTIATLRDLRRARSFLYEFQKMASRTSVATFASTTFDQSGYPTAGTLAGSSTTAGVVPTDATTGTPSIYPEGNADPMYLTDVRYTSTVISRVILFDMLWKAGAYAFNANTALSAQPSYSGRLPNTDYALAEMWFEAVTAFTGNANVLLTYTNEGGTTGRNTTSGNVGYAPIAGRMYRFALQVGDKGVQKIDNVSSSIATAGTFNVLVMRRIWQGRVPVVNLPYLADFYRTGQERIFGDSALIAVVSADSTATGLPQLNMRGATDV